MFVDERVTISPHFICWAILSIYQVNKETIRIIRAVYGQVHGGHLCGGAIPSSLNWKWEKRERTGFNIERGEEETNLGWKLAKSRTDEQLKRLQENKSLEKKI